MSALLNPISFLIACISGWLNQHQQLAIDYLTEENRNWGYDRIRGALANLGHKVSANTFGNILKRHGIEPAPERERKTTWTSSYLDISIRS